MTAALLPEEEGSGDLAKGMALVRYYFGRDPEGMSDEEFGKLLGEALWLERERQRIMEAAIVKWLQGI